MYKYNLDIKFTDCKTGRTYSIDVSLTNESKVVITNNNTSQLSDVELNVLELLNIIAIKELNV